MFSCCTPQVPMVETAQELLLLHELALALGVPKGTLLLVGDD